MKAITGIVLFIIMTSQSYAYTFSDLQGTYRLTSDKMPIVSIVTIDSHGRISLIEEQKRFSCKGTSELVSDKISAQIKCKNFYVGRTFEFGIDFTLVEDLNSFSAPLMFPMIGPVEWQFTKIN
jgi:hypothetical protein